MKRRGPAAFWVDRWQFTLVVFLGLLALGAQSLATIPKAEDPTFPMLTFVVVCELPGAPPADVERLMVVPIEGRVGPLQGIKRTSARIGDGLALVQVEFVEGADPHQKEDELNREMAALRPSLPDAVSRLEVKRFDMANVNVLEVAVISPGDGYGRLDAIARRLRRRLEAVAGVGRVEVTGLPAREVTLTLDPDRMLTLGVSPEEVVTAVGAASRSVPTGAVEAGGRRFDVKGAGDYASVDEISDTVVRATPRGAIRVRDVASAALGDGVATSIARFDGDRAVLVSVAMREGGDLLTLRPRLGAELDAFKDSLPVGVRLAVGFDQSRNVARRLSGLGRDFGLALVLVLVTLLPLGGRASFIVMLSIPLSLAVGVSLLRWLGFSVNQLTVVGFVIALGLLVDDSIVVVENVARHLRGGETPRDAAIAGTEQIARSVVGCTANLALAFLPLLALPGAAGQFVRPLPVAVLASVGASLFVSLTVVPFLASVMLRRDAHAEGNASFRWLTNAIAVVYRPVLGRALKRPGWTVAVSYLFVAACAALVPRIGFGLFPKADIPQLMIQLDAEEGTSLVATDEAARFVEAVLGRHPEVRSFATTVGVGHPQVYYNVAPRGTSPTVADVLVDLDPLATGRRAVLVDELRLETARYPGVHIMVHEFANGPPTEAPLAVRLFGEDEDDIAGAAARVASVLERLPGVTDVRNPSSRRRSDVRLRVDRQRAAVYGVDVARLDRAVRLALEGWPAGSFRTSSGDEAIAIRVTVPRSSRSVVGAGDRPGFETLDRVYVPSDIGAPIPLRAVATLALEPSASMLFHYDRERSVTVTAQVQHGFNTHALGEAAMRELARVDLPAGVRVVAAGEAESRRESFDGLGTAVLVSVFGLMALLVLQFKTFRGTLIVASVVPLGAIGGLVGLYTTGYELSFMASIGFVALMGIEIKNSILLVDYTNHLREAGVPLDLAIQQAGETRFIPVLLTTLTALGALVPLVAARSALYSPLAVVIAGGLISSTFLARIVTPVLYRLLPPSLDAPPPSLEARDSMAPGHR